MMYFVSTREEREQVTMPSQDPAEAADFHMPQESFSFEEQD